MVEFYRQNLIVLPWRYAGLAARLLKRTSVTCFPVPRLNPESNTEAAASRPKYPGFRPAATPLPHRDNFIRSGLPIPLISWKVERWLVSVGRGIMSEIRVPVGVIERQP